MRRAPWRAAIASAAGPGWAPTIQSAVEAAPASPGSTIGGFRSGLGAGAERRARREQERRGEGKRRMASTVGTPGAQDRSGVPARTARKSAGAMR